MKYKDRAFGDYLDLTVQAQLSQDEIVDLNKFIALVNTADATMKASTGATDSFILSIYESALKSYKSGKGFEGYILITKSTNGGSDTEVGRITFTK